MNYGPKDGYAFVIDTNSYTGNFERAMTAHLTGVIGECGVGEEFVEELPIDFENVMQVSDDGGCYRPTSIWKSKKSNKYESVAIFFEERPTTEQIEFMKERVKTFDHARKNSGRMSQFDKDSPEIKILGFRLIEFISSTKEESI